MLTQNALTVLKRRYLKRDQSGQTVETPDDLFRRVAHAIAKGDMRYGATEAEVESTVESFHSMMSDLSFLPNSPTLMNAGRPLGQLSACFVLPIGDSMEEIFEANKQAAIIHKSGGGTGFSFSRLRPKNSMVASTSGIASGPVSFMRVIDASTEAVKQGGTRRGANMGILRVDHPDILEFVTCKADTSKITNFNISVGVTNRFMEALATGTEYDLIDPRSGQTFLLNGLPQKLSAREVFTQIANQAWQTGEPGVVFLDRMNEQNPTFPSEEIESTNPCGEQPLPQFDSCNLGSINLGTIVRASGESENSESRIDWQRLKELIRLGVHFLDNVIDVNEYPIEQIAVQSRKNRRIGLGVMGWADMLTALELPYNDQRAYELADRVMSAVYEEAVKSSSDLARTRGRFPNWEQSRYREQQLVMRNATVTTVAPTGTISIIAGCSSGIEPLYALVYERRVLDGTVLLEVNPQFEAIARREGFFSESLMRAIAQRGSIQGMEAVPERWQKIFLTSADLTPSEHIRMQATFQKHCDAAVSKTINFPVNATVDEIQESFRLAWELGCKGITVYRDQSRPHQVLSTGSPQLSSAATSHPPANEIMERPPRLVGSTEKIQTGFGNLYVTVNLHHGRPFEVFAHIGKSGFATMADTEAICRLISLLLRSGVSIDLVIRQLQGIGGGPTSYSEGRKITSIPDAIAQVLHSYASQVKEESTLELEGNLAKIFDGDFCPQCHQSLSREQRCLVCRHCGFSSC